MEDNLPEGLPPGYTLETLQSRSKAYNLLLKEAANLLQHCWHATDRAVLKERSCDSEIDSHNHSKERQDGPAITPDRGGRRGHYCTIPTSHTPA
ncbi:hypothetical protein MTO96_042718 [Rhipicephalus appendiculatus]